MLNKHKLFLLCAKWIPVVTAIGILVITYNALIIAIVFIIRYCITECSYSYLLLSYYILAGIILLLILYIHSKKNIFIDGKDKLFIRCSKESITKCYF